MSPEMLVQPYKQQSFNSMYYPQYNSSFIGNEQDPYYYYLGYAPVDTNEDFRASFYNPFEIKHRRRTSRAQLKILEKSFEENPKPNATVRRILAHQLDMTPRGVQIWFQNRRAKAKLQRRKSGEQVSQQQQTNPSSNIYNQFFTNLKTWNNNDARFVATSAAASCFLESKIKMEDEWLNMPIHPLAPVIDDETATTINAEEWRRKSCPALSTMYQATTDTAQQESPYLSWPSHTSIGYPIDNRRMTADDISLNPDHLLNSFELQSYGLSYSPISQQLTPMLSTDSPVSSIDGSYYGSCLDLLVSGSSSVSSLQS